MNKHKGHIFSKIHVHERRLRTEIFFCITGCSPSPADLRPRREGSHLGKTTTTYVHSLWYTPVHPQIAATAFCYSFGTDGSNGWALLEVTTDRATQAEGKFYLISRDTYDHELRQHSRRQQQQKQDVDRRRAGSNKYQPAEVIVVDKTCCWRQPF